MSDAADLRKRILELPPKRLALLALELQEQLDRERNLRSEPIAVVGMACRFPGANSPEEYWELLSQGRDAITEVPADRWPIDELYDPDPDAAGKVATRWGGYLDDVQRFDAGFFSISPREARSMDPQQRLLLETCWRAFEDAAIPPSRYYGAKAGVFIGICNNDYLVRLLKEGPEAMDLYLSSGNAYSVAAGRLSFTLGLQGPAVAVDTACSSSLVALHQACQSLRQGESSLAVAGGVNVMCSAETTMALSRSHMMAPDGRCKSFDDSADGFVRAEGCGVLLLKRLSDAVRDGDRIHAVIRGSAANQDGRSTGLTVPNGPAQEQVLRDALASAGLTSRDVDYVEAHGTGTTLGDPIEIRALGRVFDGEREAPLYVGSVKTNMGHLESAAGVAGVIKAILAVKAGEIPPHLHFTTPSRHIEWDEYAVRVEPDGIAWPSTGRPRRAGVSSFGFSGTNAHVIVEQAPVDASRAGGESGGRPAELLPISGYSPDARAAVADGNAAALGDLPEADFADFCHTARAGRTHFPYRRAIVAGSRNEALATLRGASDATVYESPGRCGDPPEIVFMFTGQGAQHPGMGRALYESAPAFRAAIDRCAAILDPIMGLPLTRVLFDDGGDDAPIYETAFAQPSVVAFEFALAELWRSWGIRPAAVLGHSLGEYVAATIAGVLKLEEMLPLVQKRGRLLASLPGGQRMAAIFASAELLVPVLERHRGAYIAAYNAPENTVISGDAAVVDALLAECAQRGIEHRLLRLEQAFHSPGVEPVMDELEAAAAGVSHGIPRLPIAWNVTGRCGEGATSGAYWRQHARESVRFTQAVQALAEQGFRHFLELGPHPTLSPLVSQAVEDAVVVPSLRRGGEPWREILAASAQLYVHGADFDWTAMDAAATRRRISVPVHPFGGERYWVDGVRELRVAAPRGGVPGARLSSAVPIFETLLTPREPSFLGQHRFRGTPVLPGPLFAELGRGAAAAAGFPSAIVGELEIRRALEVPDDGVRVQTVIEQGAGEVRFRVLSERSGSDAADGAWVEHASGLLQSTTDSASEPVEPSLAPPIGAAWERADVEAHLALIRSLGFELGRDAALYEKLEIADGFGRAALLPAAPGTPKAVAAALLVDAGLQVLGAVSAAADASQARMLTGIDRIEYVGDVLAAATCVAEMRQGAGGAVVGDVELIDAAGRVVARIHGARLGRVAGDAGAPADWFHELVWRPVADAAGFAIEDLERAGASLDAAWPALARHADLDAYVEWLPALRDRVAGHIWRALTNMGMPAHGAIAPAAVLADQLAIAERHRRLLPRLLDVLAEAGALLPDGEGWQATAPPAALPAAAPAGCEPVIGLVDRCGAALDRVLSGEVDPVTLLFPDAEADSTRAIYRTTPFGRAFNEAVREAVAALVAARSDGAPLRILEVGGGSGSTTEAVLAALGGCEVEYTFTDLSPTLVGVAERELAPRHNLEFRVLDIERDPAGQDFAPHSYDLVVAANVLHATSDLERSVRHAASLLRPGGALILLEGTRPEPWVDVTFGLTEGWWRFTDQELRPDYPLLGRDSWSRLLRSAGFAEVSSLPGDELAAAAGQVVVLARAGADHLITPAAGGGDAQAAVRIHDARRDPDAAALLAAMRDVAAAGGERLSVVTENAQAIGSGAKPDPEAAALWGLGRTFALEHPELWGGLIDLQEGTTDEEARRQIALAVADADEDQVAFRDGIRHRARLVPVAPPAAAAPRLAGGTYLVTGGLGGLGLHIARWLADEGAARVALIGRSADPAEWRQDDPRHARLEALRTLPVEILLRSVDISDPGSVQALMTELDDPAAPLRGIVHAAAVFDEAPLAQLTPERHERVMRPKAIGALNLLDAARGRELDFIVFFSSTTALLGVAGLASYAAANLHLDASAARARAEGIPALSVNWGLWQEMRLVEAGDAARYEQSGLRTMDNHAALEALGRAIGAGTANAVIASVDWHRLRAVYEAKRPRPLLAELEVGTPTETRAPGAAGATRQLLEELATLPAEKRLDAATAAVEEETRAVLRLAGGFLDGERGFFDMGMDSLMSVELKTRLEKRFGARLPATLTFNYPTIAAVAGFLVERAAAMAPAAGPAVVAVALDEEPGVPDIGSPATSVLRGELTVEPAAPHEEAADTAEATEENLAALLEDRLARLGLGGSS